MKHGTFTPMFAPDISWCPFFPSYNRPSLFDTSQICMFFWGCWFAIISDYSVNTSNVAPGSYSTQPKIFRNHHQQYPSTTNESEPTNQPNPKTPGIEHARRLAEVLLFFGVSKAMQLFTRPCGAQVTHASSSRALSSPCSRTSSSSTWISKAVAPLGVKKLSKASPDAMGIWNSKCSCKMQPISAQPATGVKKYDDLGDQGGLGWIHVWSPKPLCPFRRTACWREITFATAVCAILSWF